MLINDKVDAVYIPDSPSRIKATDYNQIKNEIQECITEAGLTPTKDVIQLPQALKILTAQSSAEEVAGIEAKIPAEASETNQLADKQFVQDLTSALNFVKWVDTLPETGESKYIYAVPREETDTDGKPIAALYLWDGTEWRGAGAFSLNIDPDTLATKAELAGYLPLSGGIINGVLKVVGPFSEINTFSGNESSGYTRLELKAKDTNRAEIRLANKKGQTQIYQIGGNTEIYNTLYNKRFLISSTLTFDNNKVLDALDKAVANGVASLDANAKVPSEQIPVATTSVLGGVKPDGTTITVTEDGTISAAISGEGFATKAELQAQAAEFTAALAGKANADLSNCPANYDYVVESYKDDQGNWYRKYKSGWLEQGGIVTASGDVTLLKPFSNTAYSVQATSLYTNYTNWGFGVNKTSVSSFHLNMQTGSQGAMWEAKGQGAE